MNPLKSKRSPMSQNAKRTSGSWKIGPNVGEDFFNTIDPKRTFKAPHNPTTEVLGSFSHKRSPCRERRMRRQEFISGTAAMAATALAQPLSAQTVMSRSIKRVAIVHP